MKYPSYNIPLPCSIKIRISNVCNIKTLGPRGGKILDNEAIRVVSKLPKFIAGKNKGKKVSVKYGFPISFSLDQ